MYEPAEDSVLLAEAIKQHAKGAVLDVGTGSGILAQTAHDMGLSVHAVDVDASVVVELQSKPFRVFLSNRFSHVRGTFDTIVCNPPYLPNDDSGEDLRLYGGKKGYEYITALIAEAKHFLTPQGQLLFLISTLTKPAVVEKTLTQEGYEFEIISREKLFMEELLVYRATLLLGEPATIVGRGKRSVVYRTKRGAVKIAGPERVSKEAQLLRKANTVGVGARYIGHERDRLTMEYVDGEPFDKYVARTYDKTVMKKLLVQARALDKLGMKKQELNRPGKNILVTKRKRVVLLDFERSIFTEKPNNVTALATWLARVRKRDVHNELTAYKQTYAEQAYKRLEKKLFT
jgi:HemK-related putative methylase